MTKRTQHPDPEWEMLLSWVVAPEATNLPSAQPADWQRLIGLAHTLGLAPLLYKELKSVSPPITVPEDVWRILRDAYYVSAARGIVLQSRLEELVGDLAQAGIRPVVLKGAALANFLYRDMAVRPMSDLDLLLQPADVLRATCILHSLGYVLIETEPDRLDPFASSSTGELVFRKQSSQTIMVELHWQLIVAVTLRKATRLDADELWEHTTPLLLGRHEAWQFTPEATLIHLCAHLGVHSFISGVT